MRKVFSIILYIIAGFFFSMVCLMGFTNVPGKTGAKLFTLIIFFIPAIITHLTGSAINSFRNWKKDTGIVLISATGLTIFNIFTIACVHMSEDFREMMSPYSLVHFNDYLSGSVIMVPFVVLGWIFIKLNKDNTEPNAANDCGVNGRV